VNGDPTITVALIATAGTLLTGGITALGFVLTRGTETRKLITSAPAGFKALVDELQEERAADRAEIARLMEKDAARDEEMASLRTRMRGLEAEQDTERRRTQTLLGHIAELRSALRRAGIVPPPPPAGSGIEDSGPQQAVSSTTTVTTTTSTT